MHETSFAVSATSSQLERPSRTWRCIAIENVTGQLSKIPSEQLEDEGEKGVPKYQISLGLLFTSVY
jgi:hypothetical protein